MQYLVDAEDIRIVNTSTIIKTSVALNTLVFFMMRILTQSCIKLRCHIDKLEVRLQICIAA